MKQHIEPSHDNKHNQKKHSSPHCNLEFLIDVHFGESYDEKTEFTGLTNAFPKKRTQTSLPNLLNQFMKKKDNSKLKHQNSVLCCQSQLPKWFSII